jgi:hypothetical protein
VDECKSTTTTTTTIAFSSFSFFFSTAESVGDAGEPSDENRRDVRVGFVSGVRVRGGVWDERR